MAATNDSTTARILDAMLAEHEAEQHMGGRCDCATCEQVRALMVEMDKGAMR